jgi:UDP-glucose 4-epimerase/UDP-glucuronate decarboxylase
MKTLITGGAGFIGYHLAAELAQDPTNELTLVDNFVRGRHDPDLAGLLARPNLRLMSADVADPGVWDKLEKGYDEVYHLAAIIGVKNVMERPHEVVRVNAQSTLLLLDWFVKGGGTKLLLSSTSEAYAWTQQIPRVQTADGRLRTPFLPIPTPEDVPLALTDLANPRASYAGSKIFCELAVNQYCRMFKKPFVIVRYHNVYGPRMGYEHVIPELYLRARGGQDPLTVYSADHSRAFCYVADAVRATVAAMRSPAADNQTLNIGNDAEEVAISDLAARILSAAGLANRLAPAVFPDPIPRRAPDLTRTRALLGYAPAVTLDQGIALTINWYSTHPRP